MTGAKTIDRKNQRIGLIITLVSGLLFWGTISACVGYTMAAFEVDPDDPELACEKLVEYGWKVKVPECVAALTVKTPAP